VPDRKSRPSEPPRRTASTRVARAVVFLRFLILPAWIAGAVLATAQLPSVFDAESGELGSLLPRSSAALEVERKAIDSFELPLLSRTIVVARQPGGFSAPQAAAAARYIVATDRRQGPVAIRAVPLADAPGLLAARQLGTTLVVYLYIDPAIGESESQEAAERFAAGLRRATGAPGWRRCCWSSASSPSISVRSASRCWGSGSSRSPTWSPTGCSAGWLSASASRSRRRPIR
jgi:hypothetical protein